MKMPRRIWIAVLSSLILAGCGDREFGAGQAHQVENQKAQLDGEQVLLSKAQFDCGVEAELWEAQETGRDQTVGRLNQSARDLGFGDDVMLEPGLRSAYAQVRGKFLLSLIQVNSIKNDGPDYRVVDAKVGVRIDQPCFDNPLPVLLGVKKGQFTDSVGTVLRFRQDDGWVFDQIVH